MAEDATEGKEEIIVTYTCSGYPNYWVRREGKLYPIGAIE